jgi:hypothetical protein
MTLGGNQPASIVLQDLSANQLLKCKSSWNATGGSRFAWKRESQGDSHVENVLATHVLLSWIGTNRFAVM